MELHKIFYITIMASLFNQNQGWGQPYWFYGLFSASSCRRQSRFEFSCLNVRKTEETMHKMIQRNEKILGVSLPFCSRDVGDKESAVMESLFPLILQKNINLTGVCGDKNIKGTQTIKGVIVFTFLTFELTQLVCSLLQPFEIPLYAITYQPMYPRFFIEEPLFVFSYEASFGKTLHQTGINAFRKELNITLLAILNLVEHPTSSTTKPRSRRCYEENNAESAFCIYYELGLKHSCIKERSINIYEIEKPIKEILMNPRISIAILYGSNNALGDFHKQLPELKAKIPEVKRLYFVNFEALNLTLNGNFESHGNSTSNDIKTRLGKHYQNIFFQVPGALALNNLMYFTHDFKKNFFQPDFINRVWKNMKPGDLKGFLGSNGGSLQFLQGRNITPSLWKDLDMGIKSAFYETLKYNTRIMGAQIRFWKQTFYVNLVKLKEIYSHDEYNPGEALKAKPHCNLTKPACRPGTELVHSYYKEEGWDTSYGWFCKRCPKRYYRNNETKCQECAEGLLSDESRISCYDPYKVIYLDFQSNPTIIFCIVSAILVIFITFTFCVVWKHRMTPLVRASNSKMSFLQIITHFVFTILIIPVFLGEPDQMKCTARPIFIGVFFTLTTAINLGKTQKVLLIFKAKLRMSRKEITIAKASTLFTVLIALTLNAAVLVISIIIDTAPRKQVTLYQDQFQKELSCSNNEDIQIQFGFVFIIVFCNAIQGIRARHVPSHYRETSYVTYSSFTSSIVLIAATIVYMTQVSEHAKTITLWYAALILNCIHFILMYIYKIYVIIFTPERNTKAAFDAKRKARFQKSLIATDSNTPSGTPMMTRSIRFNAAYGEAK